MSGYECGKNSKSLVIQFLVGANSELSRIGCNKKKTSVGTERI